MPAIQPDRRDHHFVVDELLDAVRVASRRFGSIFVRLFAEEPIDVA